MSVQPPEGEWQSFVTRNFGLQSGVVLPEVTIAYRTLGRLAPDRDNVVLLTHGNTSGPQMLDPGGSTGEGSWSVVVGPDKAIDTNRFFVICPNMLGSSYGSTNAASINPLTGKKYGPDFPDITVGDIVATQRRLLDGLGIGKLVAIAGPSYGGFQAFQWAVDYPDDMRGIAAVVTAPMVPRDLAEANLGELLGPLTKDPNWNGGAYYDSGGVIETMTRLRMATLKTYGLEERLRETLSTQDAVEASIRASALQWAQEFDANSLVILAKALRGFDTVPRFPGIKAKVLYVLSRTDKLFSPRLAPGVMAALKAAGIAADYFELDSEYGHRASGGPDALKWTPRLRQFIEGLA